jgi:hypothetical protein
MQACQRRRGYLDADAAGVAEPEGTAGSVSGSASAAVSADSAEICPPRSSPTVASARGGGPAQLALYMFESGRVACARSAFTCTSRSMRGAGRYGAARTCVPMNAPRYARRPESPVRLYDS